jgi:hypothetical protein
MLTGFSCSGYGGSPLFRHGRTALPAYREHLLYRVTSTEQGKPVALPARGRSGRKADRWRCGYEIREEANAVL